MYAIDDEKKAMPLRNLKTPDKFRPLINHLAWKIYLELSRNASCPNDVAKKLGANEQNVYYHIRQLRKGGLIKLVRTEERQGATAKIYGAKPAVLAVVPESGVEKIPMDRIAAAPLSPEFLTPFVENGRLNCRIVVGSPDPHGRYKARASDAPCAIDLALFFGSFATSDFPAYKLDTEMRDADYASNLILLGGPKANLVTAQANEKLPVRMDETADWSIVSTVTGRTYSEDENGFIVRMDSPFAAGKKIIVIAGKRFPGTRAAVLAFVKHFDEVAQGNRHDSHIKARIVRGIDVDGDGVVDEVEFLE